MSFSNRFEKVFESNDKLRNMELKQIEQEQFYIQQLKEQRERMELLRDEFSKKDSIIGDLQAQNRTLQEDVEKLKAAFQDLIQIQENDMFLIRKMNAEKEEQSLGYQKLVEENNSLKTEISKLDDLLFQMEPLREENSKLNEELSQLQHALKHEKKRIQSEMKQSRIEANKQIDELKQLVQEQLSDINKLQVQKKELQQNVDELKKQLKRMYEREESEIKIKSEIERVRQDLISVRNQEVQKMNQLFDGILRGGSLDHSRFN
ncbi:hypothetical protein pb186bvf_017126 [Paramecium bursaria]